MSSSDFRGLALGAESKKAERLFRAAISAFCCLTRPSRRDIAQLEDLTLPLFESASVESLRYVAAALSECDSAPNALVRRLCNETVDIAAPLLIRSKALSDIDLIALIGRHGLGHARAIARRPGLNPTIADLIGALDRKVVQLPVKPSPVEAAGTPARRAEEPVTEPASGGPAESARSALRSMMRPADGETAASTSILSGQSSYARLCETALSGNAALFQTALADGLAIEFSIAGMVTGDLFNGSLIAALRALDLSEAQAFLIVASVRPAKFSSPEEIRLFLERFRRVDRKAALERVRNWKAVAPSSALAGANRQTQSPEPATPAARRVNSS